jgi:protease IV
VTLAKDNTAGNRSLFSYLLGVVKNYFMVVGILATIAPLLMIFVLSSLKEKRAPIEEQSKMTESSPMPLKIVLSGSLREGTDGFSAILNRVMGGEESVYLTELQTLLKRAARDPKVAGAIVQLDNLQSEVSDIIELREEFVAFKNQGKFVHMIASDASFWHYYLVAVADKITINPASSLMIPGPVFQLIYFGEALRKLGVDVEVLRAGKYKSAFEPFVTNVPSPETLEQYQAMENSLRTYMIEQIAQYRKKSEEEVRGWLKQSIFTAQDALNQGLIDEIGYPPETVTATLGQYRIESKGAPFAREVVEDQGKLALVRLVGDIMMSSPGRAEEVIAPKATLAELKWAEDDDEIKAVVLRINSPGGSAVASDMIWQGVKRLAEKKPVVVSMGSVAASGGYYIAACARKILAHPATITGSIGVIGMLPNFEPFGEKYGVTFHVVTGSDRANLFSMGKRSTSFDKALMESTIEQVYQTFLEKVALGRNMEVERVHQMAQGRVYTGVEALSLGLVDQLGGLQDAFASAKEMAGLDPEKLYPLAEYDGGGFDLARCFSGLPGLLKCLGETRSHWPSLAKLKRDVDSPPIAAIQRYLAGFRGQKLMYWPGSLTLEMR